MQTHTQDLVVQTQAGSLTLMENVIPRVEYLRENKLIPPSIKTTEQAIAIIQMGATLGMNEGVALQSLEYISGSLTIKAKIMGGLLSKNGIATRVVKDKEPVYKTVLKPILKFKTLENGDVVPDTNSDGKPKYVLNEDGSVATREDKVLEDYVTTIVFKRYYEAINEVVENEVSFYWSDAVSAGWSTKSNWTANPRYMMYARCLTRGARMAAGDIVGGLYDNLEMLDVADTKYKVGDDGEVTFA